MDAFSVQQATDADGVRLVLGGELDLAGAGDLQDAATRALREQPAVLVVDLDGLRFIDSSGIAALLQVSNQARAAGVAHRTQCAPTSDAHAVIATLGLQANLGLVATSPG